MILSKIKQYAFLVLGFVATVLGFFAMKQNRDKWKGRAERAEAKAHRVTVVAKKDSEVEEQHQSRRADAANEIKNDGFSSDLANPNDRWVRDRKK